MEFTFGERAQTLSSGESVTLMATVGCYEQWSTAVAFTCFVGNASTLFYFVSLGFPTLVFSSSNKDYVRQS